MAIVACMAVTDARAMIGALAEPQALLVFAAIVTATSTARLLDGSGHPVSGTSYITPFGLQKKTSLPREAIERAARRLKQAGLLEVLADEQRGYESWRVSETALATVIGGDAALPDSPPTP
jgi:biotin operon repressor